MSKIDNSKRSFLKTSAILGVGVSAPMIFTNAHAAYRNEPKGSTVTFGFNVPQTGAYADEGADELRLTPKWTSGSLLSLQGRTVKLRFTLQNAKLYAFDFNWKQPHS